MFEFFVGKENMKKLIESVSEKTSEKIVDFMKNTPKAEILLVKEKQIELEKKNLEVDLLKMEKEKKLEEKNKIQNSTTENNKGTHKWHEHRLKFCGNDFASILLNHKEISSPQAAQGMWQAYGQMQSGRTTGRFAILATGVGGFALWFFQQYLSTQKKEIEQAKKDNEQAVNEINLRESAAEKEELNIIGITFSHEMLRSQIKAADKFVENFCKEDKNCLKDYELLKNKAIDDFKKDYEEKNNISQNYTRLKV